MNKKEFAQANSSCWDCDYIGHIYLYGRHYFCANCWDKYRTKVNGLFDDIKTPSNSYYHKLMKETLKNE